MVLERELPEPHCGADYQAAELASWSWSRWASSRSAYTSFRDNQIRDGGRCTESPACHFCYSIYGMAVTIPSFNSNETDRVVFNGVVYDQTHI
jgi:hypothetical protein